jgi:hypothetical protein
MRRRPQSSHEGAFCGLLCPAGLALYENCLTELPPEIGCLTKLQVGMLAACWGVSPQSHARAQLRMPRMTT